MAITYLASRGNNNSGNQSASVLKNPTGISYLASRGKAEDDDKNRGGLIGGIGYLGEKTAVGFVSSLEGIFDYASSGLAKLFGNDAWAEDIIENDWFGDWYSHPEEWFNPGRGWQFAGDVAGGIGTSLPGMAAALGTGAIIAATGGAAAPVVAAATGGASFLTAGLGAAGRSTKEAYEQTGKLTGKEFGYGALTGLTEGGIEAVSNVIGMGSGAVVKSFTKAMGRETAEAFAKQGVVTMLGKSFAGEAFEEAASEILDPYWKRATYDKNARNASVDEILYAGLVGGFSGMLMGGSGYAYDSASSFIKGNKLSQNGRHTEVIETAGNFAAFEELNNTEDELFLEIKNTRDSLLQSLAATGGVVQTVQQKRMLGSLSKSNVAATAKMFVAKRAVNVVNNAETIAQRLTSFGYKTADGKPITFTAEEITAGYDPTNPSSIYKALKTNEKLRSLAVADATGQLMLDTSKFAEATLTGQKLASQVDLNRFLDTADPKEIAAVSEALKIDDWSSLTIESFNQKITDFVNEGGVQRTLQTKERKSSFAALPAESARPIPKLINIGKDGARRYNDGNLDIAVERQGDEYTIYDYSTDNLSKSLTRSEVNGFLRDYAKKDAESRMQNAEPDSSEAAGVTPRPAGNGLIEGIKKFQSDVREIDSYARENIKEYRTLNAPNQSMIRKVIREGRAKGVSDSDVLMYAKISAHSGIDIQFDKEANYRGVKEDGNADYADGFYEASQNRIVVNPEGKRTAEKLLIHELDHAIRKGIGKDGATKIYLEAIEGVDASVREKILQKYKKTATPGEAAATVMDETNAYYAEQVLSNRNTLEKLVEAEPTLKDKILSFFKVASTDYADVPKLSGAAKRYYRTYKKLFDEFSARNAQSNATENAHLSTLFAENAQKTPLTNMNQENMNVSDRRYAGIEEFSTPKNVSWRNVAYDDIETKAKITSELHQKMVDDGLIVKIADETTTKVKESYPDLTGMKKKERLPILKESIKQLKSNLRTFLTQLKGKNFEFEVEGDVLEAKLYNVGIDEVLEKVTQDKAEMLYTTEEIFKNSKYLYSTPDYDGDPNIYRWNYFYTPVQIGDTVVGVRIAIRDMINPQESQIYNWGIKKDTSLDGIGRGTEDRISYGISSDVSVNNSIPQPTQKSNSSNEIFLENSSDKQFALDIDDFYDNGEEFSSPTISTVGKERVNYKEKAFSKEWRKTKSESAYIHAVDEMYGIQSYLEKVGKVKNAKAIIQNVRSTPHQAQTMIGSVQYNVFQSDSKTAKKMGEGLNPIFRPIEKMGEQAYNDFNDYLLHYLNIDRLNVLKRVQKSDKDAAESLRRVSEEIDNLENQRNTYERRIFKLGDNEREKVIKNGLKKSIENIDNAIIQARADEVALLGEAPGYAEAELKRVRNEIAELLGEKERAKAEIFTLGSNKSDMTRKAELRELISEIESKSKRLSESAAAMEEIAKAYKIAQKPVFYTDGEPIGKMKSKKIIREYEKKYPEFKKTAQKVWKFNKNMNRIRVSAGLMSKSTATYLGTIYPHYVPAFKAKINNGVQAEGGVSVASTVKKAKGYNSDIMDVKESMASQVSQLIRNGNINMLANKVYDTAVKTGDSKYVDIKLPDTEGADISTEGIERPKPHSIRFFKGGKEYQMFVSDEIYQGFKGVSEQSAPHTNVFARVTNWISDKYKKLVTSYSPAFMIRNAIRDMQDAGLNSKHPLLFARNISRAWVELVNNSENWQTYRAYGGFSSTVFDSKGVSGDVGARGFEILGIKDRIESGDKLSVKDAKYLKSIFTGVENLNAVVEQIPRFAEYLASIEAGETIEQAVYNSAEVTTNFARRGSTTKQLNATIIPFLNPAVQGFDKIFRNVTDAAKAGDGKAVTKAFATLLGKAIAIGIMPMLFNSLMYDDDEDYEDLREEDKENNYLIKLPNGTFIKLPRGRVASVIGGLYNRTVKMAKGEDADWAGYASNVVSQVTPVENLTRTVFSPFMDVATNRTWYGTEIEGMQFENVRPKDRYDESTSSIAIAIGQAINYSPKKIHYLIDQYSGVIGDFLLPATTKKAEKDFFSGNFTLDPVTSNKISTKFYEIYDEVQYSKTDGSVKAVYQAKYLNKVKGAISELYKEINAIQSSELSSVEKLQQTRVLRIMINEAMKNAIADFDEIERAIDATANMGFDDSKTSDVNIRYAEITRMVYGSERALSEYNSMVYSNMSVLNTAGLSFDKLYDYYFGTKNIESDKDREGNSIFGSKRKKVIAAINGLGVSLEQRLLLICASGYALKDGDIRGVNAEGAKNRLLKYILKLRGLTADEKGQIAEMCGFTVRNGKIVKNLSLK